MKAFVTGVGGQLGFDVMKELINRGYEVMGVDIAPSPDSGMPYIQMDITNGPLVEQILNKAARPFNSRLDKTKLREKGFEPPPHWQDALSRYLKELEV